MRTRLLAALSLAAALLLGVAQSQATYTGQQQQELQIGEQVFRQLDGQGKIIRQSPDYAVLNSLAHRIAPVANAKYFVPFHFILVRDAKPNAFAVPGGNVYVTNSMMTFVKNKEELSGVMCHEVSHTIHHDVYDLYAKSQRVSFWAMLAQLLLAQHSGITSFAIDLLANVQVLRFSRDVEHNADVTGAYICGESGVSPWGMVWLMKRFLDQPKSNPPEFLSDHPTDSHRISDLERLFAENPQTFGRFNSELANATTLSHPGLRDQYKPEPTVAPVAASRPATPRPTITARPKPGTKPTCPPGWKFCPKIPG